MSIEPKKNLKFMSETVEPKKGQKIITETVEPKQKPIKE